MMWPIDPRSPMRFIRGRRAQLGRRPRRWAPQVPSYHSVGWPGRVLNLWYDPTRGFKPVDLFEVVQGRITQVHYFPRLEVEMKRVKIGATPSSGTAVHLAPVETEILGKLPNVVAHCCVTRYEDGEPRRPGWITVKTMGAAWVIQCKDPDSCASLTATADTLDNALSLADLLLGAEEAPWENDPFLKRLEGKKK
jgi:hypothetical protein